MHLWPANSARNEISRSGKPADQVMKGLKAKIQNQQKQCYLIRRNSPDDHRDCFSTSYARNMKRYFPYGKTKVRVRCERCTLKWYLSSITDRKNVETAMHCPWTLPTALQRMLSAEQLASGMTTASQSNCRRPR